YLFAELRGLGPGVARAEGRELDLIFLFDSADPLLDNAVGASHIGLFCTFAVNLFPRSADRVHLSDGSFEHHIVPDRTRPMDFEVHSVARVVGHGTHEAREFSSFYAANYRDLGRAGSYYTLRRVK